VSYSISSDNLLLSGYLDFKVDFADPNPRRSVWPTEKEDMKKLSLVKSWIVSSHVNFFRFVVIYNLRWLVPDPDRN
jgi:hypothetical protein